MEQQNPEMNQLRVYFFEQRSYYRTSLFLRSKFHMTSIFLHEPLVGARRIFLRFVFLTAKQPFDSDGWLGILIREHMICFIRYIRRLLQLRLSRSIQFDAVVCGCGAMRSVLVFSVAERAGSRNDALSSRENTEKPGRNLTTIFLSE